MGSPPKCPRKGSGRTSEEEGCVGGVGVGGSIRVGSVPNKQLAPGGYGVLLMVVAVAVGCDVRDGVGQGWLPHVMAPPSRIFQHPTH